MEPVVVVLLSRRRGLYDLAGGLGEVLGQIPDVPPGLFGAAEDALRVDLPSDAPRRKL